mmetsp:Transcript_1987/g.7113  ORF Transcript_1987/g.7113 Transcript_1987/m.7113 type:complete len:440 (+) Transcript_1987:181-1500(+)|eukprot:scaffold3043_cov360-Prasinococcus_capsulatus_cf.AAC.8
MLARSIAERSVARGSVACRASNDATVRPVRRAACCSAARSCFRGRSGGLRLRQRCGQASGACRTVPRCLFGGPGWDVPERADDEDEDVEDFAKSFAEAREARGDRRLNSELFDLIDDVTPLDVSALSADASPDVVDAMKRTISGMLGILPSDQFQVVVETLREPLERLLVSSITTGYTLRNAESRLGLNRLCLPIYDPDGSLAEGARQEEFRVESEGCITESNENVICPEAMDVLPNSVADYVAKLEEKVISLKEELDDTKKVLSDIEENGDKDGNNELLKYLRSLDGKEVLQLSEPASDAAKDAIDHVVESLLGKLGGRKYRNMEFEDEKEEWTNDTSEVPSFQTTISASRDYIARLLFWCMLMGRYIRITEQRLELERKMNMATDGIGEDGFEEGSSVVEDEAKAADRQGKKAEGFTDVGNQGSTDRVDSNISDHLN